MIKLKDLITENYIHGNPMDDDHKKSLKKTGFWGKQGAGAIIMARTTGRLLLQLRSNDVQQGGSWGVWGGAVDSGFSPKEGMVEEVEQETGLHRSQIRETIPLYVFKDLDTGFKYYNFLITVDDEFIPRPAENHEWEIDGFRWIKYGRWPTPLHFGLTSLIQNSGKKIKNIIYDLGEKT